TQGKSGARSARGLSGRFQGAASRCPATRLAPAPRPVLWGVIVGPVPGPLVQVPHSAGRPGTHVQALPSGGDLNGKGWKVPDGGRRGVLREVQDKTENFQPAGSPNGQRPPSAQRSLSGLRHRDVQDPPTQVTRKARATGPSLFYCSAMNG